MLFNLTRLDQGDGNKNQEGWRDLYKRVLYYMVSPVPGVDGGPRDWRLKGAGSSLESRAIRRFDNINLSYCSCKNIAYCKNTATLNRKKRCFEKERKV